MSAEEVEFWSVRPHIKKGSYYTDNIRKDRILALKYNVESFIKLKGRNDKESQILLRSIQRVMDILRDNPQFGNPIKKELIPDFFKNQGIKNLYRVELSNFWRMLYTIEGNKVEVFLFILTITDHNEYNKLFGYKKR